jgi:hypothetical protein
MKHLFRKKCCKEGRWFQNNMALGRIETSL